MASTEKKPIRLTLKNGLILSLLLHSVLSAFFFLKSLRQVPLPAPQVTVELVETPATLKTEKKLVPVPKPRPQSQIVQQDEDKQEQQPVDTRFLGPQNKKVEKQTVARQNGEFANRKEKSLAKAERSKGKPEKPQLTLKDLSLAFDPMAIKLRQQSKKGGDVLQQDGAEVSRSNDYLRDVDSGDDTLLNTREFKYHTYYSRIRRQLAEHWELMVRDKFSQMFRQGRRVASHQDHITKLLIVLNNQGLLVKVQILTESGVRDLDDAAIEAFRSAAPFPNPPKGIIEKDGTVRIRWDFVVES